MNKELEDIFDELETDLKSCFFRYKRSFSYKRGPYSLDWLGVKRRDAESEAVRRVMELPDTRNKTELVNNVHKKTDEIEYDHFGILNRSWKEMR
jgi:hypothetical protein